MSDTAILERTTVSASAQSAPSRLKDDAAMLKAAAGLTRDLNVPKSAIYWTDMLGSALLGYAGLIGAMVVRPTSLAVGLGLIAVLALYRAGSFIHELTHIKRGAVKGFRFAWNLVVGVPLLVPSFMYEGVHNQHHAKRYYGTSDDPEYLPLALMHPWTLPVFLLAAALAPIGMLLRFGILAAVAAVKETARSRGRALFGPADQSEVRPAEARRRVRPRLGVAGGSVQRLGDRTSGDGRDRRGSAARLPDLPVRFGGRRCSSTRCGLLVAHLWENDGEPMSVTAQFLDSVNVPPPATLPALWAPLDCATMRCIISFRACPITRSERRTGGCARS